MKTRFQYGFTLVEMLIIMGLIGVLAAITVPNFIKARSSGNRSACIANLRQVQDAKVTWAMENNKAESEVPDATDLYGPENYLRYEPVCPAEGSYEVNAVGKPVTCSLAAEGGHSL